MAVNRWRPCAARRPLLFSRRSRTGQAPSPNQELIARYAPGAVDGILIGHSHYDHLLDAPTIAKRTNAMFAGTESTLNVARASGPEQMSIDEDARASLAKFQDEVHACAPETEVVCRRTFGQSLFRTRQAPKARVGAHGTRRYGRRREPIRPTLRRRRRNVADCSKGGQMARHRVARPAR